VSRGRHNENDVTVTIAGLWDTEMATCGHGLHRSSIYYVGNHKGVEVISLFFFTLSGWPQTWNTQGFL